MNQTSPYTITRFHVLPIERLLDHAWVSIAVADLDISGTIRVRDIWLEERVETGARRVVLPKATEAVRMSLPLYEIASVLSAAYDDEMAHLTIDDEDASDEGYYGSAAHEGDVPHPGIGSVTR